MAGIYIHIPFCRQACFYCDFHFSTNLRPREDMVKAIGHELSLRKDYLKGSAIQTVYFGGGTPSLLSRQELEHIFSQLHQNFAIDSDAEITLEANPDDLSDDALTLYKGIGINRLSIGIQSFDDAVLKSLNRAHNGMAARSGVMRAQDKGFNNISIDLIYAIPQQDIDRWAENVGEAIRLQPQHISSYSLTIEEKTMFGKWAKQGKFKTADDDVAAGEHERLVDLLNAAGFEHYEVSNFARPGYRSRHNTSYWLGKHYLGIGPGAHSFDTNTRQFNVSDNRKYISSLQRDEIPSTIETLSAQDKLNEYLMISLRTSWGVDLARVRHQFCVNLSEDRKDYIRNLEKEELATVTGEMLVLTRKGLLLADEIAMNLIPSGSQLPG
ncbi:radical SAM family heme chaperone HemW [Chryseolinea sp. T2]